MDLLITRLETRGLWNDVNNIQTFTHPQLVGFFRRLQSRDSIINELVGRYEFTRQGAECIYENHHLFVDLDEDVLNEGVND
jgi:hypothetical protein